MQVTSERRLDDGVVERELAFGAFSGLLWTPPPADPAPLILVGHPGGLSRMYPRIAGRARYYAVHHGFAAAAIELPGSGDRLPLADMDAARARLRTAIAAGERPSEEVVEALILPLVEAAVPEWQATIDALLAEPGIGGPVGCDGGLISVGIRLAGADPRIAAAVLFAGSYVPRSMVDEARRLDAPLQVLLQWDDEGNDRQLALDLFDALGSREKTLHANLGGHTGIPAYELEAAGRFFERHLRGACPPG
jgi:hypothetical protein